MHSSRRSSLFLGMLFLMSFGFFQLASAGPGDTIRVMTWVDDEYTWPVTHQQTFSGFPDTSKTFRKIILRYTLGCASGGCDPWDVGAPIHIRRNIPGGGTEDYEIARFITPYSKTGIWDFDVTDYHMMLRDSVTLRHRNASYTSGPQGYKVTMEFIFIEGTPPREAFDITRLWQGGFNYGNNTVSTLFDVEVETNALGDTLYQYTYDKFLVIDSVIGFDSAIVGTGTSGIADVLGASSPDGHTQILFKASELTANGLTAGDLTGLRFNLQSLGGQLNQLSISMKQVTQTTLTTSTYHSTGFTKVYQANTAFATTGWNSLQFTSPFSWNGTDNLLIDICYDNKTIGTDNIVNGTNTGYNAMVTNRELDYYMEFSDTQSVRVPGSAFTTLDSFITVSFWQQGDIDFQPQSDIIFEGRDANDDRVINAHLPWGNGRIYWDAGNVGSSYDRIDKLASVDEYQGFWTHWAMTKNVATGDMHIYKNGHLWHSGTGFTRLMSGITELRIGASGTSANWYDGKIDEFQVWDKDLDSTTIQNWMHREVTAAHPAYGNLLAYFRFNDGTGTTVTDDAPGGNDGVASFSTYWEGHNRQPACDKVPEQSVSMMRPNIVFEQGTYTSHIDSILVDSSLNLVVTSRLRYNNFDSITPPMTVQVPLNADATVLKFRTTGHGFGGNLNCAEFCPRDHHIKVNGSIFWTHRVWNDDCGMNACYPQGGTWIYDRAGWCPGEDVETFNVDMTSVMTPGTNVTLDYSAQDYTWNGQGSTPNWNLANHLVYFHPPAHSLDASVDEIISPNTKFIHGRFNPICGKPEITIQNTGTTTLTSLDIHYRVEGGADSTVTWTGNLAFLEKENVELGLVDWTGAAGTFKVWVSNPNGGTDEYALNDTMRSVFSTPPSYPNDIYLLWRTNAAVSETKYQLLDAEGNLLYQNSPFIGPNSIYRDTFQLNQGCYTFRLYDTGKDGLDFFANNDGTGFARMMDVSTGNALRTFNPDFGTQILWDFTVDTPLSTEKPTVNTNFQVFPNPTTGQLQLSAEFGQRRDGAVQIVDMVGKPVLTVSFQDAQKWFETVDLSDHAAGIYFVRLISGDQIITRKVVLTRP